MTPEGKIKAKFNTGLKKIKEKYGNLMVRMPVTRGMGRPLLDYIICANGRFIMVEAKRDASHDLTPQQKITKKECEDASGRVIVIFDDGTIALALQHIRRLCELPPSYRW